MGLESLRLSVYEICFGRRIHRSRPRSDVIANDESMALRCCGANCCTCIFGGNHSSTGSRSETAGALPEHSVQASVEIVARAWRVYPSCIRGRGFYLAGSLCTRDRSDKTALDVVGRDPRGVDCRIFGILVSAGARPRILEQPAGVTAPARSITYRRRCWIVNCRNGPLVANRRSNGARELEFLDL